MTKTLFVTALAGLSLAVGVGGCAKDRHEAIPDSALQVSKAEGDIKYTAPDDGEVYVYDQKQDELIYSGRIRKGETLSLEPEDDEDKIRIDQQVVSTRDLKEGNKHTVFFKAQPPSSADLASDSAGKTVTEERTTTVKPADAPAETKTVTETETRTTTGGDKVIVEEKKTTESKP